MGNSRQRDLGTVDSHSIGQQIRRNVLALLSLIVALSALSYNTWRNEASEQHRNIRAAEFEMLKELSELQQIIDYAYLRQDPERGDLSKGLGHVLFIHDLAELTPQPVDAMRPTILLNTWNREMTPNCQRTRTLERCCRSRYW